jgi:hypothetical protein
MLAQPGILWPFQNISKLWVSRLSKKKLRCPRTVFLMHYQSPPAELKNGGSGGSPGVGREKKKPARPEKWARRMKPVS